MFYMLSVKCNSLKKGIYLIGSEKIMYMVL